MKKSLIFFLAAMILFSGCVGQSQKVVKNGDNVSIDYVGSVKGGKVFDTSIESVAKQNNVYTPGREYKPFKFTVGKGEVIKGLDNGVIGMKAGDSKNLTIPPEEGYGPIDPTAIQVIPIIQNESTTVIFPKVFEMPRDQFEGTFGRNHTVGDVVTFPQTDINLTILKISSNVSLSYNLKTGQVVSSPGAPWNETVEKIDDKNITIRHNVKPNEIIQFPGTPWNTTVIGVNSMNITLRHNPVPDTQIQTMFGTIRVHFNETSVIMDRNNEFAGKTLLFNITLISID